MRLQGGRGSDFSGDEDDDGQDQSVDDTPEGWSRSENQYELDGEELPGERADDDAVATDKAKAGKGPILEMAGGATLSVDARSLLTEKV